MKNIANIPFDDNVRINDDSKVFHASSLGVGGVNDEIRIILCNKKLINDEKGFKMINESDVQVVLDKKTAIDLKNLLEQYVG